MKQNREKISLKIKLKNLLFYLIKENY